MNYFTSKRHSFKNFFNNNNLGIYIAAFLLMVVVITVIIIFRNAANNAHPEDSTKTAESSSSVSTSSSSMEEDTQYLADTTKYNIMINLGNYTVKIFDANDSLVRSMNCAIGSDVSEIKDYNPENILRNVWSVDAEGVWRYTVTTDSVSFHSFKYTKLNDKSSMDDDSYNQIGQESSDSGISLSIADAYWIYLNVGEGSTITIYTDRSEEKGTDEIIFVPEGMGWDPTDTDSASKWSPYEVKSVRCVAEMTIDVSEVSEETLLKKASAKDINDNSIVSYIYLDYLFLTYPKATELADIDEMGQFYVWYRVADRFGNLAEWGPVVVTVKDDSKETTTDESDTASDNESSDETKDTSVDETKDTSVDESKDPNGDTSSETTKQDETTDNSEGENTTATSDETASSDTPESNETDNSGENATTEIAETTTPTAEEETTASTDGDSE